MPTIIKRTDIPDTNYSMDRLGNTIRGIVNHTMWGSLDGTDQWFHGRGNEVSAHYGVGRDGRIFQWVEDQNKAYSNGLAYEDDGRPYVFGAHGEHIYVQPDRNVPFIKFAVDGRINANNMTLSIEHEDLREPNPQLSEAQYQSTLWLHRQLLDKYNLPASRLFIVGHNQIDNATRAGCPGSNFPWARLITDLGKGADFAAFTSTITSVVVVRTGPGRRYPAVDTLRLDGSKTYTIVAQAHGDPVWDPKRNRFDDVWVRFDDIEGDAGYITRTVLNNF